MASTKQAPSRGGRHGPTERKTPSHATRPARGDRKLALGGSAVPAAHRQATAPACYRDRCPIQVAAPAAVPHGGVRGRFLQPDGNATDRARLSYELMGIPTRRGSDWCRARSPVMPAAGFISVCLGCADGKSSSFFEMSHAARVRTTAMDKGIWERRAVIRRLALKSYSAGLVFLISR